jgi:RNA polymerase sigma-70 factor (ECF subfamily)
VFSHLGSVAAYARRRGNRDADAVAAEVMTIAWRRLTDVPVDDPRPWLYATARNLVLADARRSSLVATGAAGERVDAVPAPEILELDPALGEALQALSRLDREALLLVAWEDLTPGSGGAFPRHQPDGVPRAAPAGATAPAGEAGRGSERRQLRPECQSRGGDPMSNRSIMFRLRRANPLPEAPAEDAADLFAGFEWPEPLPLEWDSVTTRGAGGGRAVLIAMNAWECYWVEAIRSGDQAAGQHAREELNALLAQNVVEAPLGAPEGWTPTPPRATRAT